MQIELLIDYSIIIRLLMDKTFINNIKSIKYGNDIDSYISSNLNI